MEGQSFLTQLSNLDLPENQIADIKPLQNLKRLEFLDLSKNKIVDVSPLAEHIRLMFLTLDDNEITDITPLVKKSIRWFGYLSLQKNPLNEKAINEDIPAIKLRLVNVIYEKPFGM